MFEKFTDFVVKFLDLAFAIAICYKLYLFSGSWILGIAAYPLLLTTHALFVSICFVKELTLDEDKLQAAIEEAYPWLMTFDAAVFMLLFFFS